MGARWHWGCTAKADVRRVVMLIGMVVAYMGMAGCYEPSLRDCKIQCSGPDQCIGGQVCLAGGYCAGPNVSRCTADGEPVIGDAAAVTDAAADLCSQGCGNGTCIGGVCTIDCSHAGSCPSDVVCPANLPCHVICGDSACGHKVNCTLSTSCDVDCVGDGACGDEIQCPSGRNCDVTCSGQDSCQRRTKCSMSCGCDVTCSGSGSCMEASECPAATCRVGNGCSTQPSGCNTCL